MVLDFVSEVVQGNLVSMVLFIISSMLIVTLIAIYFNRDFETNTEFFLSLISPFVFLFLIFRFANSYPYNLLTCYLFAGVIGWMLGPTIDLVRKTEKNGNELVALATIGTLAGIFSTATIVYVTNFDFSFLYIYLFAALTAVIAIDLLRIFVIKTTRRQNVVIASFGAITFIGYLLFDIHRLKTVRDATWGNAVSIAVSLYLDIVNLFLKLLDALSNAN